MRTFEFSEGTSNKFWNITLTGKSFTVNYGKIGTAGQTKTSDFADAAAAQKEHDKLVAEKVKKGYSETTKGGAAKAPAAAAKPAAAAAKPAAVEEKPAKAAKPKEEKPAKAEKAVKAEKPKAEEPTKPTKVEKAEKPAKAAKEPVAAPAKAASSGGTRTFEFSEGTSNKFWNITLTGKSFTVNYGKIGTAGQTKTSDFADAAAAQKEHDKLVAEKVKKGYSETTKGGAAAKSLAPATPPPPAAPLKPEAPARESKPEAPAREGSSAPPAKRTFEFSDATSHKFWNIERTGPASFTVTYGRIGTAGQSKASDFASEAAAQKEHDKLITEKTKKGYKETSPSAKKAPGSLLESLEQAILDDPEDMASHSAYADYLLDQGDPRGEFIQTQLALESGSKSPEERKRLLAQEKKLLKAHARTWLGDLAPFLLDEDESVEEHLRMRAEYTFRRGWLDTLTLGEPTVDFARALGKAPEARLLRRLEVTGTRYEDEYEPGPDVPEDVDDNAFFYALSRAETLTNVRTFVVGQQLSQEEDDKEIEYGPSCHTAADGVLGPIKKMPRLEELRLLAHRTDTKQLFALKTLHNLRILHVDHCHEFPLEALAKNPSLGKLEQALFWPHATEGEGAYIRLPGVRALVTSENLSSLTHIRLRCSDMGDDGVRAIVESGALSRLKWLDLRHGRVSDEGARLLAGHPGAKGLERLDLCNNCLTADGIAALESAGVKVMALDQWNEQNQDYPDRYLYAGDYE